MESSIEQYLRTVRPMHEQYVAPSKRFADLVISGDPLSEAAVGLVAGLIAGLTNGVVP